MATEDVLYWPFSSNGIYSCKSGYRFLKDEAEQSKTNRDPPLRDKHLWKSIWSMHVAQKVMNFLWWACRNAMLTRQALVKRTIIADLICERCRVAVKDPLHALWSCSKVDIVWADQTLWDLHCSMDFDNIKQLVSWIIEEGKQLELFAYTAWSVWNQCNQVRIRVPATALHQIPEVS